MMPNTDLLPHPVTEGAGGRRAYNHRPLVEHTPPPKSQGDGEPRFPGLHPSGFLHPSGLRTRIWAATIRAATILFVILLGAMLLSAVIAGAMTLGAVTLGVMALDAMTLGAISLSVRSSCATNNPSSLPTRDASACLPQPPTPATRSPSQ